MDENVNITTEAATDATAEGAVTADQSDAFMDGFDDAADGIDTADQPEQTDGEEAQETEQAAEQPQATETETQGKQTVDGKDQAAQQNAAPKAQEQTAPQEWIVKHMNEQRTLTAKDITPELLQKGLDYDRVRSKYDEAKPVMEMFSGLAAKAGMSVADFAKSIRAEQKKAQGMSDADARRAVELEDREAAVAAVEAEKQAAAQEREQSAARRNADIAEFARAFPEAYEKARGNPKEAIPQQVWDDVNRGFSLTAAYGRYVMAQAQAQVQAANQRADTAGKNAVNAARSTGSQKSAGNDTKQDSFLAGFDG